jgi:hypothetical protein
MPHSYLKKSQDTYDSGEVLRKEQKFNSSIHCYYYSCIQLCNHFFNTKEGLTDSQIRDLFKSNESHKDTIKKLVSILGRASHKAFTSDLSVLKDNRVKADYRNFSLGEDDSDESKELCDNVVSFLKKAL